jgi:putative ABC transport system permease protein
VSATWRRLLSAGRRHDRWLLIRLAAQNVGSRRLRVLFLGAAVMLRVGIGFASFIVGWELRDSIGISFARMGADLVVVPPATLVNITSSLLTVQPTDQTLPVDLGEQIAGILGIARVAPQRIVPALVEGPSLSLRIPSAPFDGAAGLRRRTGQRSQGSVTST